MKKTLFSIVLLMLFVNLQSQELPKITPPSPEASSLGKFELIPISHFTGLPNISVPLFTINQDGITIPISLSYHARGMKVEEISPRVGIGWALNYGGSLSRQARGFEDEANFGYLSYRNKIKNSLSSPDGEYDENLGSTRRGLLSNTTSNHSDITPDKFIYNANGTSGDFFIDYQDLGLINQSYDDIKIEEYPQAKAGSLEGFKITDRKGNVFYFGRKKNNNNLFHNKDEIMENGVYTHQTGGYSTSTPTEGPYPNAWMLMEIETVNGSSIIFTYHKETTRFYRRTQDVFDHGNTLETHVSEIDSEQWQISEITFDQGKIKFLSDNANPRQDVMISSGINIGPLGKVQLYDKNDELIKQYQMTYEYKQSITDDNSHFFTSGLDSKVQKRLFLKTISEQDSQGVSKPPQVFYYNNQQIPNRFSNSQDIWGYYNGAPNGHYLTFSDYNSTSNNRTVDTIKSKVGLLEKIIHPTGGTTEFTYEQNKGILATSIKDVVFGSINPFFSRIEALSHLDYAIPNLYDPPPPPGNNGVPYFNFSTKTYENHFEIKYIHHSGSGGINANVNIQVPSLGCDQNNPNQSLCNFLITLEGGAYTQTLYQGSNFIPRSLLPPGQYILKVKPQNHIHDPYNPNHAFMVDLQWLEQKNLESEIVYAGGKRIKRIENKDTNGNIVNFKEYEYKDENGITSGKIVGLPNYGSISKDQNFNGYTILEFTNAAPGIPLSSMQGNSIGYEYVTEYFGDKSNNIGKIEYRFTVFEDTGDFLTYPQHIPTDNSWLRGKNWWTKIYGVDENNNYIKQKEILNKYLYGDEISPFYFMNNAENMGSYLSHIDYNIYEEKKYYKDRRKYNIPFLAFKGNWGLGEDPHYKVFSLTGGTQHLLRTIEKSYNDSGVLENSTTYGYNYNNHYQIAEQEVTNSLGNVLKTKYHYPSSTNNETLFDANRIVPPIKTETFKNNLIQSTTNIIYNFFSGNYLPEEIENSKGTNPLEGRVVYHDYDNKGNPIEVSKKDGTHIVYIWGYDKTQPIAKIENAIYSQVQSQVANLQTRSNNDNDRTQGTFGNEGQLRNALTALRNSLPNSQVTTFTYDPLIGVTSITDPRGQTIYYHYDSFNRLEFVKDNEGNILSENQYNYKN